MQNRRDVAYLEKMLFWHLSIGYLCGGWAWKKNIIIPAAWNMFDSLFIREIVEVTDVCQFEETRVHPILKHYYHFTVLQRMKQDTLFNWFAFVNLSIIEFCAVYLFIYLFFSAKYHRSTPYTHKVKHPSQHLCCGRHFSGDCNDAATLPGAGNSMCLPILSQLKNHSILFSKQSRASAKGQHTCTMRNRLKPVKDCKRRENCCFFT